MLSILGKRGSFQKLYRLVMPSSALLLRQGRLIVGASAALAALELLADQILLVLVSM